LDRDFAPLAAKAGEQGRFLEDLLEIGVPMKGLDQALTCILMRIVTKGRLLALVELNDPFHGGFRWIIALIIRIGIVIVVIPDCSASHTQVENLQGDECQEHLTTEI